MKQQTFIRGVAIAAVVALIIGAILPALQGLTF